MFTIIGLMLTGMLLGYLLRKRSLHKIHTVITVLIWALLFILGIEVGGNEQIIKGLHTIRTNRQRIFSYVPACSNTSWERLSASPDVVLSCSFV